MDKVPNFAPDVDCRSDEDIIEIIEQARRKYEAFGSVPILPLTEKEFRRLEEMIKDD